MSQVNKNVYPDVSSNSYSTSTLSLSGSNFQTYQQSGLEHSITYTASTNPKAPFRNATCSDMRTTDLAGQTFSSPPLPIQRIALAAGWPQNFGSDVCSVQQILNHPWDNNFSGNTLYSAYKWNAICGRIICTFFINVTGSTVNTSERYMATWKDFKDTLHNNPGYNFVLESVWAADVKGGPPEGSRANPIKGVSLYKYPMKYWNSYSGWTPVTGEGFTYGSLRPPGIMPNEQHRVNGVQTNAANSPDMCWPIFNFGYGVSGDTFNSFGFSGAESQQINAKLVFGIDQDAPVHKYQDTVSNQYTYGIASSEMGVESLINYIEEKAATLGIILFQDCKGAANSAGAPGPQSTGPDTKDISSIAAVFGHTDIFVPITDEDGYFNGDFLVYGDDPTGTSAERMIIGDKDTPFDDGASPVDPVTANGLNFIFEKGTGEDANYFLLNFGVEVANSTANFYPTARGTVYPDLPGEYEGKRIVPFFGSPRYQPVLRWQSLRTQYNYSVPIKNVIGLQENWLYNALEQDFFDFLYSGVERTYTWDKGNVNAAIRCLHWPVGVQKTIDEWDAIGPNEAAADFGNWKSFPVLQQFSLGEIVNYMKTMEPEFENDDIYSELFLDFVNVDTGNVNATLSVDYSGLYDTGTDPYGGGGNNSSSDNQWDNDDTDPRLNPDEIASIPVVRPNLGPVGVFNKTYAINSNDLQQLADVISSNDDDVFDKVLEGLKMFGANPINALVDLRLYPYDVAQQLNITNTKEIILGRYETGIMGANMAGGSSVSILDLGRIYIPEQFKSFLDYEPYTVINLYIPYIGTVELPPSQFMSKTVDVKMVVDYTTGAALAIVYSNGIPIIYQNGVIGTSIAMTGDSAAAYANGIINNFLGAAGSAAKAVGSAVAKPTPGTITNAVTTGITSIANALSSIDETHFQQAGSASPCCNNCTPQHCYVTIARPVTNFSSTLEYQLYGTTVGYATSYSKRISELEQGGIYYGVLAEHVGIAQGEPIPTAKEIDLIKQALNNGFYVGGVM